MHKVIKNLFLGISALVSIAVVSKMMGHPPRGVEEWVLYAFPGGILMVFIFDPLMGLLGLFGLRPKNKTKNDVAATAEARNSVETPAPPPANDVSEKDASLEALKRN